MSIAKRGGSVSKIARQTYELEKGNSAVTREIAIDNRYIDSNKQIK